MRSSIVILAFFAIACGSDATAPRGNVLVGSWGGPGLALTADRTSVHATFECDAAVFHGPLLPNQNGEFVLPGTVSTIGPQFQLGAHGVVSGVTLTIEVIRWYAGGSNVQQFTLTRDKPADLSKLCATD